MIAGCRHSMINSLHFVVKWQQFYFIFCKRTNLTRKFKLLGEILRCDLYYFLTHPFKWKFFGFETYKNSSYFMFNFYQINMNGAKNLTRPKD